MRHPVIVANSDQNAAGTRLDGLGRDLRLHIQVEFFEAAFFQVNAALVDLFGNGENHEQRNGEANTVNGGDLFGEQVRDGHQKEDERGGGQADRNLEVPDAQIARHLVFLVVPLVAQHQHTERFQEKAPHHAERVSLAEQVHVAAAQENRHHLHAADHIDQPRARAESLVRLAEPVHQHAVLGQPVHHTVGADDRSIYRAGENQHADEHHEDMEHQAQQRRSGQVHGETAQQVVDVLPAHAVRDDHHREHRNHTGAEHGVDAHQVAGIHQVLHLRIGNFAVDLGQGLEAAHGEQGVAEGDDDRDRADLRPDGTVEPAERVFAELYVLRYRQRRKLHVSLEQQGDGAPDEEGDHHDRGDLHDAQRLAAGFMDTADVTAPEVGRNQHSETGGEEVGRNAWGNVAGLRKLVEQVSEVKSRADHADGSGENVVEDQRRNREPGHEVPHGVAHHDVHSAAHEHAARFQVHRADREAEQHHREDEPRRALTDGVLGDAAGIKRGRCQIAEHHCGGAPERDEGECYSCGDHHLRGGVLPGSRSHEFPVATLKQTVFYPSREDPCGSGAAGTFQRICEKGSGLTR